MTGNSRMGGTLTNLFNNNSSPTSSFRPSETEYDRNLRASDVDIRSLPSFNKRQPISDPPCRNSDNDEVLIIDETEVTSTVESEKPSQRRKIKYSASSLPSTSSVSSAHNQSNNNEVDSTSSSQLIISSSDNLNNAVTKFTNASQKYLSSVKNNNQTQPSINNQTRSSNNPFNKKNTRLSVPVIHKSLVDAGYDEDVDDDDFEATKSNNKSNVTINRRSTRNTKKVYSDKGGGLPEAYLRNNKQKTKMKPSGPGASLNDPVCLDDNEDIKVVKKKPTKLIKKPPSLSSRKDFGVVSLKIKEMKFGSVNTNKAIQVKITESKEILIDFKDIHGETKMSFISYQNILVVRTHMDKEPFLIVIDPKPIIFPRLNTFFNSIQQCHGALSIQKERSIIILLEEGLSDQITQDQFYENLKHLKSNRKDLSKPEIENYLKRLSQEIEEEDPLASSKVVPTVIRHIPLERPQRPQRPHIQYRNRSPILLPVDQDILDLQDLPKTPDSKTKTTPSLSAEIVPDSSTFSDNENVLTYTFQNFKTTAAQFVITVQDMGSLEPECYLNDQIINFFLRYYWDNLPDTFKETVYVFSTFFFSRLVNTSRDNVALETPDRFHNRVQSWTKGVNIFDKKYVLVPVCQRSHWFIVIMCHLGDYDPSIEPPKIAKPLPARKRKRSGSNKRSKRKSPTKEKPDVEVIETVQEEEEECVLVETNEEKGLDKREDNYTITEDKLSNGGQDCTIVEKKNDEETAINELCGLCDDKESISSIISDSISYMSVSDGRDLCMENSNLFGEGHGLLEKGRDLLEKGRDLLEEVEDMEVDQKEGIVEEQTNNEATIINCITESSPERDCSDGGDNCDSGDESNDVGVVSSSQDNCVIQSSQEKVDRQACLIVLDSMLIKRRAVGKHLKTYLTQEYKKKYPNGPVKNYSGLPISCPSVPAQDNGFDCGVYMLTYIESFFKHIEEGRPLPKGAEWIGGNEMNQKRKMLKTNITSLSTAATLSKSSPTNTNNNEIKQLTNVSSS